jgi:hypothetical protein
MSMQNILERSFTLAESTSEGDITTIVNQAVLVFTLMSDGQFQLRSLGESGGDDVEKFTDDCIAAWRELMQCSQKLAEANLEEPSE